MNLLNFCDLSDSQIYLGTGVDQAAKTEEKAGKPDSKQAKQESENGARRSWLLEGLG